MRGGVKNYQRREKESHNFRDASRVKTYVEKVQAWLSQNGIVTIGFNAQRDESLQLGGQPSIRDIGGVVFVRDP